MLSAQHLQDIHKRQSEVLDFLDDKICIVVSAYEKTRNSDVNHAFRQDSNFTYLSGFPEPDTVLVFDPKGQNKSSYFVRESDRFMELWNGFRFGIERTLTEFEPDVVYSTKKLEDILLSQLCERKVILLCEQGHPLEKRLQALTEGLTCDTAKADLLTKLGLMRSVKSPWELEQMRHANKISCKAHHASMKRALSAENECQVHAEFNYTCLNAKSHLQAYPAIVASGKNATCLHYGANNAPIERQSMILIDAGCEINGYAADITRTFPASGKFSPLQKKCYQMVLKAQIEAINAVKPGNTLDIVHQVATKSLISGMIELGILSGSIEENIEKKTYADYYPHGTGHWLGLDVHDVGPDKDTPFKPGMVITVEPGFYVQEYNEKIPVEFKGIGIRIEDNILVTEEGHENLTSSCFKNIEDIEKLQAQCEA